MKFKFDTALEDPIQDLAQQHFVGNIMWKSVKLHFSVDTNILDCFKVSSLFHGLWISDLFYKSILLRLKDTVLSKNKIKLNFVRKNSIFDQTLRFLRIFEISQLKLRSSSFQ